MPNFAASACAASAASIFAGFSGLVHPGASRTTTPSSPTKSSGFRGFDSNKLLIIRGGNYHIHIIV